MSSLKAKTSGRLVLVLQVVSSLVLIGFMVLFFVVAGRASSEPNSSQTVIWKQWGRVHFVSEDQLRFLKNAPYLFAALFAVHMLIVFAGRKTARGKKRVSLPSNSPFIP